MGAPAFFSNAGADDLFPRVQISYWCPSGHETRTVFAELPAEQIPLWWDCPRCGKKAGRSADAPPPPSDEEPFKSHLEYVKERRSASEAEALLERALRDLREKRGL